MRRWYPVLLLAIALGVSVALYQRLPERMPVHWNAAGEVDGYGSRAMGAFLMPTVMLGIMVLVPVLPRIDPRQANYEKFKPTYYFVMNLVLTFMFATHFVMLAAALGSRIPVGRVIPFGVGVLLAVLGNVLPRARSNWTFGIRTPWTLSSDRVWERTHRVGGYLMVAGGVAIALAALGAPMTTIPIVTVLAVAFSVGGAFIYSYAVWRQEKRS